jgi:hypothetical protein
MKIKAFAAVALCAALGWTAAIETVSSKAIAALLPPETRLAQAQEQTYREPSGLFEISLPPNYSFEETGSGISFTSADQTFGGSVDYGSTKGATLSADQMEVLLKQEYEQRLSNITWQATAMQPDGSVRLDWVGEDQQGNQLDAISFIEQRGNNIFILTLFGVNAPYNNEDAEVIVQGYRAGEINTPTMNSAAPDRILGLLN